MISHRTRIVAAVIITIAAVGVLAANRWLDLDEGTRALLRSIVEWALALVGGAAVADALFVERRRVDPARSALPDDVRDELPPER